MIIIGVLCLVFSVIIAFFIFQIKNLIFAIIPGVIMILTALMGVFSMYCYWKAFNEVKYVKKISNEFDFQDKTSVKYFNEYILRMKSISWYYAFTGLDSVEFVEFKENN